MGQEGMNEPRSLVGIMCMSLTHESLKSEQQLPCVQPDCHCTPLLLQMEFFKDSSLSKQS